MRSASGISWISPDSGSSNTSLVSMWSAILLVQSLPGIGRDLWPEFSLQSRSNYTRQVEICQPNLPDARLLQRPLDSLTESRESAYTDGMEINLRGKVGIVTGAGRGIGREIARTFAREGVHTIVTDVVPAYLEDVAKEWRNNGWSGQTFVCDVRDKAQIGKVVGQLDRIDI